TNHSFVFNNLLDMTNERIASSLALPPALRITYASPSLSPAILAGSSRQSMQVKIANFFVEYIVRSPLSPKVFAYNASAANISSWVCRAFLFLVVLAPDIVITENGSVKNMRNADRCRYVIEGFRFISGPFYKILLFIKSQIE